MSIQFPTQADLFRPPKPLHDPFFVLEVEGRIPSWNEILGMEHWQRYKFKNDLAQSFLSALRDSAGGSSTSITSAKSTTATFADTLDAYLETVRAKRRLKSRKKRLAQKSANLSGSKSFELGETVPF